jgi:hypothetical protein
VSDSQGDPSDPGATNPTGEDPPAAELVASGWYYYVESAIDADGQPQQLGYVEAGQHMAVDPMLSIIFYSEDWSYGWEDTENYCGFAYSFPVDAASPASLAEDQYVGFAVQGRDLVLMGEDCSGRLTVEDMGGEDLDEVFHQVDVSYGISPNNGPYASYVDSSSLGAWFAGSIWTEPTAYGYTVGYATDADMNIVMDGNDVVPLDAMEATADGHLSAGVYDMVTFPLPTSVFGM